MVDTSKQVVSRRVVIRYPVSLVGEPLIYRLARDFGLVFNILRANVNPEAEGLLVLEISGPEEACRAGLEFLETSGVDVQPLALHIHRDETKCTHCGICCSVCPTEALRLDHEAQEVLFQEDLCIACGLCVKACPMKAMLVEF
jgi:ferredoxin